MTGPNAGTSPCLIDSSGDPIPGGFDVYVTELEDQDLTIVGQESFEAEDYAFITWEARGTAWDIEVIESEFGNWNFGLVPNETYQRPGGTIADDVPGNDNADNSGNGIPDLIDDWIVAINDASQNFFGIVDDPVDGIDDDDDSLFVINQFNPAFVDDVFEKIKLQIGDLNNDGRITPTDIDDLVSSFGSLDASDLDYYDYDNNGSINADDAGKYVFHFLGLWAGDANGDGIFNSTDLTTVFQAGEFEDGENNNSTWAEGDWTFDSDFSSSDLVAAYTSSQGGGGYADGTNGLLEDDVDNDNDGQVDELDEAFRAGFLPVWNRFVVSLGAMYHPYFSDF